MYIKAEITRASEREIAKRIMPEGKFLPTCVEGEATNEQILELINARLLVMEASGLYANTNNPKPTYLLDPRHPSGRSGLTMEELEAHIKKMEEEKSNFLTICLAKHRSEFHELDEPKNLFDYVKNGRSVRVWEVKGHIEGLQEGECVFNWMEEKISEGYNPMVGFAMWHVSIIKNGLIIADKIVGYT